MLEQMRRQGASIFIYVLFGLLIISFIYGLAPSTRSDQGCGRATSAAITVDGVPANNSAFLVAFQGAGNFLRGVGGREKVYWALDYVIRRELLAQEAEDRGLQTTGALAQEAVKRGEFFLGGFRLDVRPVYFDSVGDEYFYNHKKWKSWVSSLNVSEASYLEEQARGLQAAIMGDLIGQSARVSREEARANYLYENNTVTYDVVGFEPDKYRAAMQLTDADIKRFLEGHAAEVEARYKADERTYKGIKPQLALRAIFIPKAAPEASKPADGAKPADDKANPADATKPADDKTAKPADDKTAKPADDKTAKVDDKAAPRPDNTKPDDKAAKPVDGAKPDDKAAKAAGAGDKAARPDDKAAKAADDKKVADKKAAGAPPKPYGLPIDAAKTKLEAVRASIAAGKLTFADAEKQLAADASEDAPASNGDRGWRSVENPGFDDKEVNDAVKALKPGEMTPVIVTERGAHLVIATDKREGDLSFDQVKTEIASELAKVAWSKEAAKRDALDALAKASGKNLEGLFERELVRPPGLEEIINNPNLTPEQKQQLLQQLMQQDSHGSLRIVEKDVPVSWTAEEDGSGAAGGSAPAAPAAGAPAAGSPAAPPATGSPATDAPAGTAPAPAAGTPPAGTPPPAGASPAETPPAAGAGSAAGTAPPAAPAAATPASVIEATKDVLPQFGNMPKAKVNRLGPAPRMARMPGIGASKAAINALFDELAPNDLAKQVYEGEGGTYVVLQLINRAQPNADEFDKTAGLEIARMQQARGKAALRNWLKNRCEALSKDGKIRPHSDRIRETDDKGNPTPTVYRPCMLFDFINR
jgi:hypothetical protein